MAIPLISLVVQGCISLTILFLAGSFIDTILYSAPVVWLFFLGTGISVFVLRKKEPQIERSYRISGFPLPALIFCAACIFMFYSSFSYALARKPIGLLIVVCVLIAGAFVYWITERGRPDS